ncbi:otoancorin [Gastrophryne carolinensis]
MLKKLIGEEPRLRCVNANETYIHYFCKDCPNSWTSDLKDKVTMFLYLQGLQEIGELQDSVQKYIARITTDPEYLLSELPQLDHQLLPFAIKYLFVGKKEDFIEDTSGISLNFEAMREGLFQWPTGNRTLFYLTYQRCLPALNSTDCVEMLGELLRLYGTIYLDTDMIAKLPAEISDDPFRNLSSVFRDLYDKMTATNQRAIHEWMTQILRKTYPAYGVNESSSWVTAESLWIMGRFMVLLPLEEIKHIHINEIRMFISYDNATKQLDTVYDITQGLAKALLERILFSGFDMRNISTIYRLGLLVCFYDDIQEADSVVAKALLHQMMKCNQLKGFHAEVQKLKTQLLHIAILNQTLNNSLGSLSDAVVGLTISQLESLSPEAVQGAILTLQQVSGWTKSQIMILTRKFLHYEKNLTYSNVSQLGELVTGVSANLFYEMNAQELLLAMKNGLSQHALDFSPAQQESILNKMVSSGELQTVLPEISGTLFKELSLTQLSTEQPLDIADLNEKVLRTSQALLILDILSKEIPLENLLSIRQLVKGITCEQIDNITDLKLAKLVEKNLELLSPYQIHCLAWKYWKVSKADIPPFLLAVLPTEYFASHPVVCKKLLISLRKMNLNYLLVNVSKKTMVINKVNQCLNGSIGDVYDLDFLGSLICHLSPRILRKGIQNVTAAAINQLKACSNLSYEQNLGIKYSILQYYGSPLAWSSETAQDLAPFWHLLSKEEIMILMKKFQNLAPQMVSESARIPQTYDMLSAFHSAFRLYGANDSGPGHTSGENCTDTILPSADAITLLGDANIFWSDEELQCMSMEAFAKTVHILGGVKCFNQSQLSVLKDKAKVLWGSHSKWKSYHITALERIATALNVSEIDQLNLSCIDMVSSLTQQRGWSADQAKSILQGYLKDSEKSVEDLRSFELVGLGGSLCAAEPEQIDQIKPMEFRSVISRLGALPCSQNILKAFKKKAEMIYGKVETWRHFVLRDIGYIAAAFSKEEFEAIDPTLMAYIQPAAIPYIPEQTFKELSAEHIANLGPENGAMVTESQRSLLNTLQLQGLNQALEGIRAVRKSPPPPTTQHTTTAILVSPVSHGDNYCNYTAILNVTVKGFILTKRFMESIQFRAEL